MINLLKEIDLKDSYLIIPSVSVGNVGQLAIDLLISSLQLEKIGIVWNPAIIPIIGSDPYNTNTDLLTTACELYADATGRVVVLQIRSGIERKLAKLFFNELCDIISDKKIKEVVILTSCFHFEKHSIQSSNFRYLSNEYCESRRNQCLGEWLPLERTDGDYHINGGGFALHLYRELTARKVAALLVMKYCSEGDNVPDSLDLVKMVDDYLKVFENLKTQIVFPPSWDLLFGGPPPNGIY